MPVSPVTQYHDVHSRTLKNIGNDNSSTFSDTLLKQRTFVARKNARVDIASSTPALESGGQRFSDTGQLSSQTLLASRIVGRYQNEENESQQGGSSGLSKDTPVAKKESRTVRIQNYLQGMLKDKNTNILLGTLNKANPTVSHVVRNNENIKGYHWDIIHAKINSNKPYSTASAGTSISINPNTLELVFTEPLNLKEREIPTVEKPQAVPVPSNLSGLEELKSKLQKLASTENSPFVLGSLSKKMATVSQVVSENAYTTGLYKEIIYSNINRNKPYNSLQPGTKICINPVTLELIFEEPLTDKVRKGAPAKACPDKPCTELSKNERLQQYVASLEPDSNKLIKVGTLGKDLPSISQVLNNDQRFAGYHWGIILSDINRDKPFNSLTPGTQVSINPANLELLFNVTDSVEKITPAPVSDKVTSLSNSPVVKPEKIEKEILSDTKPLLQKPETKIEKLKSAALKNIQHPEISPQTSSLHQYIAGLEPNENKLITIGTLSKNQQTVSQMLSNDQRFAGYHWDIILSDVNRNKPFNSLAPGTQVSINPENLELLFNIPDSIGKTLPAPIANEVKTPVQSPIVESEKIENLILKNAVPVPTKPEPPKAQVEFNSTTSQIASTANVEREDKKITTLLKSQSSALYQQLQKEAEPVLFTEKIAASAKQMVGKFSNEVNNYELLLHGLQSQGIEYEGKGGLKENLGQLASLMWLDESALQNVDGLIKIAGETVYSKTISKDATQDQLNDFTDKMAYYLEKGLIVTMSTPTLNQTGIISSNQGDWTIVNSNQMAEGKNGNSGDMKRVDEVSLNQRITEIHSKAAKNDERLSVKLSWLEENILRNTDTLIDLKKKKMGLFSRFPRAKLTP